MHSQDTVFNLFETDLRIHKMHNMHDAIPPPPFFTPSHYAILHKQIFQDKIVRREPNWNMSNYIYIQITLRFCLQDYIITEFLPFTEGRCVTTPTTRPKRSKPSNPSIIIHIPINGIAKLREEKKHNSRRRKLSSNPPFDSSALSRESRLTNGSSYHFRN